MIHYEYVLLEIIGNYNEGNGISNQILDRLFYDKRVDEGVPLEELYNVRWLPISEKLQEIGFITVNGLRKKITPLGTEFLREHKDSQS